MATKSWIQRYWDIVRGKRGWGAVVNLDERSIHYGTKYLYTAGEVQPLIKRVIEAGKPAFIPRPGRTELKAVSEFLNMMHKPKPVFTDKWRKKMSVNAGFFTPTNEMLTRYCCEILTMAGDADIFVMYGAVRGERIIAEKYLSREALACSGGIDCIGQEYPWTEALRGKKVLVLHPFVESIKKQYQKGSKLFSNPRMLPEFELLTIKAVQSSAGNPCEFRDWFAALDHMKSQIDQVDFDVGLVGAGAYATHLAHHCKTIGRIGIQVASFGQLLFGIYGSRWMDKSGKPADFANEHWVTPAENERPANAQLVEDACYW